MPVTSNFFRNDKLLFLAKVIIFLSEYIYVYIYIVHTNFNHDSPKTNFNFFEFLYTPTVFETW